MIVNSQSAKKTFKVEKMRVRIKQLDVDKFVYRLYSVFDDKIQAIYTNNANGVRLWWVYGHDGKAISRIRKYKTIEEMLDANDWRL